MQARSLRAQHQGVRQVNRRAIIASLGWGVWRFYAAPPIFGFDPFLGYFAGTLYERLAASNPAFIVNCAQSANFSRSSAAVNGFGTKVDTPQ